MVLVEEHCSVGDDTILLLFNVVLGLMLGWLGTGRVRACIHAYYK